MDQVSPSPSPSTSCANCHGDMHTADKWCPTCGQKAYDGPPSFWQLMSHFFEAVFSLDNRLFRTLVALLVPGRLTNYFLAGKQKPYFHPLRLFFFSGVIMVAAYSFFIAQEIGDKVDNDLKSYQALAYQHRFGEKLRVGADSIKASFAADSSVILAADSLLNLLGHATVPKPYSINIGFMEHQGGLSFKNRQVYLSRDDIQTLSLDSLSNKVNINGAINRYQFKQVVRANQLDSTAIVTMISQAIWGFLILIPLIAGVLKLLHIRRKRRYVEHFIFSLHTHAFVFIVFTLTALVLIFHGPELILLFSILITCLYVLFALKRVYKQGWLKTLAKAILLSWSYFILFTFAMSLAAILAVAVF